MLPSSPEVKLIGFFHLLQKVDRLSTKLLRANFSLENLHQQMCVYIVRLKEKKVTEGSDNESVLTSIGSSGRLQACCCIIMYMGFGRSSFFGKVIEA